MKGFNPRKDGRRLKWFQVRLRSLLFIMLAVSCLLGWYLARVADSRREWEQLRLLENCDILSDVDLEFANHRRSSGNAIEILLKIDYPNKVTGAAITSYGSDRQLLKALSEFRSLEDLSLWHFENCDDEDVVAALNELTHLRCLKLDAVNIRGDNWDRLDLPNLETLSLNVGEKLCDNAFVNLSRMSKLNCLHLKMMHFNQFSNVRVNAISALGKLVELRLRNANINNDQWSYIHNLSALRTLDIQGINISDSGLRRLATPSSIAELNLADTDITDEGLRYLSNMPQLKRLSLFRTAVTDSGAKYLASLRNLEEVNLGKTMISNQGLSFIAQLPNLKTVNLSYTRVSYTGVDLLVKNNTLEKIVLTGVDVNDASIIKIKRAKPTLEIITP